MKEKNSTENQIDLESLPPKKREWLKRGMLGGLRCENSGVLPMFQKQLQDTKTALYLTPILRTRSDSEEI